MPFTSKSTTGKIRLHVRAIIAVLFVLGLTWGFFQGLILPDAYQQIAMIAIVWYFSKRQADDDAGSDPSE
jgi:hypothetical protein